MDMSVWEAAKWLRSMPADTILDGHSCCAHLLTQKGSNALSSCSPRNCLTKPVGMASPRTVVVDAGRVALLCEDGSVFRQVVAKSFTTEIRQPERLMSAVQDMSFEEMQLAAIKDGSRQAAADSHVPTEGGHSSEIPAQNDLGQWERWRPDTPAGFTDVAFSSTGLDLIGEDGCLYAWPWDVEGTSGLPSAAASQTPEPVRTEYLAELADGERIEHLDSTGGRTTVVTDRMRVASWIHDEAIKASQDVHVIVSATGSRYQVPFRQHELVATLRSKLVEAFDLLPSAVDGDLSWESHALSDSQTFAQESIPPGAEIYIAAKTQPPAMRADAARTAAASEWLSLQWVAGEHPLREFADLTVEDPVVSVHTRAAGSVFLTASGRSLYWGCRPSSRPAAAKKSTNRHSEAAPADSLKQATSAVQAQLSAVFKKYDVSIREAFDSFDIGSCDRVRCRMTSLPQSISIGLSGFVCARLPPTDSSVPLLSSLEYFLDGLSKLNISLDAATVQVAPRPNPPPPPSLPCRSAHCR